VSSTSRPTSPSPSEWQRVAQLFAKEIAGFAGERVVFVHSAGTLDPDRLRRRGRRAS
jgi:hypothetical protein